MGRRKEPETLRGCASVVRNVSLDPAGSIVRVPRDRAVEGVGMAIVTGSLGIGAALTGLVAVIIGLALVLVLHALWFPGGGERTRRPRLP